jgi:hypothetical protein
VAVNAYKNNWVGFQAAHVFPLAYEQRWKDGNYSRWITIPAADGGTVNSIQNGILLRSDIHARFDTYDFSIDPDVCIILFLFGLP